MLIVKKKKKKYLFLILKVFNINFRKFKNYRNAGIEIDDNICGVFNFHRYCTLCFIYMTSVKLYCVTYYCPHFI